MRSTYNKCIYIEVNYATFACSLLLYILFRHIGGKVAEYKGMPYFSDFLNHLSYISIFLNLAH